MHVPAKLHNSTALKMNMDRCFVERKIRVQAQDHDKFSGRAKEHDFRQVPLSESIISRCSSISKLQNP